MPTCSCPVGTAIPTITPSTCPYDVGQIQKVIFQRDGQIAAATTTLAKTQTVWTALLAAADATRCQVSPYVFNAAITPGDAVIEGGGDNSTLNGIGIVTNTNPSQFEGYFREQQQSVIAIMRDLQCEDLQVYFINGQGKLIHKLDSSNQVVGFPIEALWIGDPDLQGFGAADKNTIMFQLAAEWADTLTITTGSFSFLTLSN